MWLITEYEAVTLFSLKFSSATASGGKTLLVPTPYAVKMALLDVACRQMGVSEGERRWPEIRDASLALRPASRALVTNLFQKVLRPRRNPAGPGDPDRGPFQKTIGYREYVHLVGPVGIALGWSGEERKSWLAELMLQVNYLGKRGSFIQVIGLPEFSESLPPGFVETTTPQTAFVVHGVMQVLDDCGPGLTFSKANIYSKEKIRTGKDRVTRNIVLPYRLTRSSKSFSYYERIEPVGG